MDDRKPVMLDGVEYPHLKSALDTLRMHPLTQAAVHLQLAQGVMLDARIYAHGVPHMVVQHV